MNVHRADLAQLSEALRGEYAGSPRGEKMTAIHLFGLAHADALSALTSSDLQEMAIAAGLSPSFATELRKMVKLSRYVVPKSTGEEALSTVFERFAAPLPAGYKFDRDEANAR